MNTPSSSAGSAIVRVSWRHYLALARPDHWVKNVFMLPGAALAAVMDPAAGPAGLVNLILALVATCLVASANYTINEWLDAEFDRHHPVKSTRPSALGLIRGEWVYAQYFALAVLGIGIAAQVNRPFLWTALALLVMGIVYNVRPMRSKDKRYLDVLSESINNPLRLMLGWFAITTAAWPPGSILVAYWMGGAYLMAMKRYAEFRLIADPTRAARYRKSFETYTETSLLVSAFFYALTSSFLLGIFLIKYRIEFLLSFPFFALLFAWYLSIAMRPASRALNPEKLFHERQFVAYVAFLGGLVLALFFIDLPWLRELVAYHVLGVGN